jgi:hypothetical protein
MFDRFRSLFLCAGLLLLVPSCQSRDASKILGRWQVVSAPGVAANIAEFWEFKPDGTFTLSAGADGRTPFVVFSGQYQLDYSNHLHMDHLNKPVNGKMAMGTHITITGDAMTMEDNSTSISHLQRAP